MSCSSFFLGSIGCTRSCYSRLRRDGWWYFEKLRNLDASAIATLHRDGHLEAIYMALASLAHLRDLIERMNRRVARR